MTVPAWTYCSSCAHPRLKLPQCCWESLRKMTDCALLLWAAADFFSSVTVHIGMTIVQGQTLSGTQRCLAMHQPCVALETFRFSWHWVKQSFALRRLSRQQCICFGACFDRACLIWMRMAFYFHCTFFFIHSCTAHCVWIIDVLLALSFRTSALHIHLTSAVNQDHLFHTMYSWGGSH